MLDKEVEFESIFGVSIPGLIDLGFIEAIKNRGNFNWIKFLDISMPTILCKNAHAVFNSIL